MIRERQLLKVAWLGALVGMLSLFILVHYMEPEKVTIDKINENLLGHTVEIKCRIKSIFVNDGHIFLTLEDKTGKIKAVIFKTKAEKIGAYKLEKDDNARINGKVSLYKNELEIIADNFKIL